MEYIFNIANYLQSTIATRKAIDEIRNNITLSDNRITIFNFKNIDFISRSFADEFIQFIESNNINARLFNLSPVVKEMLDAVKKNRKNRNKNFHNIAVTHFSKKEQLNQFLSLI